MKASLHIQVSNRNGKSIPGQCFVTPPFKIADITEDKSANDLHIMIMNSSPGVLDGDEYEIKIDVEQNCSLHLHTQSYQRLFTMKNSASQRLEVSLADGAAFTYLPHPSVPHRQSNFKAQNNIYLSAKCRLAWGEIFTCGRNLNNEVFSFTSYQNLTKIYLNKKLVIKENLFMQPSLNNVQAMGLLEGFTHQASFIYLDETADVKWLKEITNEILQQENEIEYGITAAPVNGIIVRILGYKSEQLFNCLKKIASLTSVNSTKQPAYES